MKEKAGSSRLILGHTLALLTQVAPLDFARR
uniref:Uncharacterized protein n=1 Tax=Ralstonia solanacearum TaxID=305 RepID=A0A0S4V6W2_RALSL|nr:protein of unknown function [Ralstonia solanacearum]